MRFTEYGRNNKRVVLLLPGTCCTVSMNFSGVIPALREKYYVVGVDYTGFDGSGRDFTDMTDSAERIERYVLTNFNGRVFAVYGSGLGASLAAQLAERRVICAEHIILGSPDMEQEENMDRAYLRSQTVADLLCGLITKNSVAGFLEKLVRRKYGEEQAQMASAVMGDISSVAMTTNRRSVARQYYYDLITPLGLNISVPGTRFHIFYAAKMGKKYLKRCYAHFFDPHIITRDYAQEELLLFHPDEWFRDFEECVGG